MMSDVESSCAVFPTVLFLCSAVCLQTTMEGERVRREECGCVINLKQANVLYLLGLFAGDVLLHLTFWRDVLFLQREGSNLLVTEGHIVTQVP